MMDLGGESLCSPHIPIQVARLTQGVATLDRGRSAHPLHEFIEAVFADHADALAYRARLQVGVAQQVIGEEQQVAIPKVRWIHPCEHLYEPTEGRLVDPHGIAKYAAVRFPFAQGLQPMVEHLDACRLQVALHGLHVAVALPVIIISLGERRYVERLHVCELRFLSHDSIFFVFTAKVNIFPDNPRIFARIDFNIENNLCILTEIIFSTENDLCY